MLGSQQYRIKTNCELTNEGLKSLVFFYGPLIGEECLYLYQYLLLADSTHPFDEINELLSRLNISIDTFEKNCDILNEYKLLSTLSKDNKYVFVVNAPLTRKQFINDDLFVRSLILKISGKRYQELLADLSIDDNYSDYQNVSKTFNAETLKDWSKSDESYLRSSNNNTLDYSFNTLFDVNRFLKDISTNLLPLKLRNESNLKQIAIFADLYNISYETMKKFLPKICNIDSNSIDFKYLKYLCIHANSNYQKIDNDNYDVPCVSYLMSLQDGKEVSEFDKNVIYKLASEYKLTPSVINVLLQHCLRNCDNHIIEKYIYGIASDLHRNDIKTSAQALQRLDIHKSAPKDELPTYDTSKNPNLDEKRLAELLNRRNN